MLALRSSVPAAPNPGKVRPVCASTATRVGPCCGVDPLRAKSGRAGNAVIAYAAAGLASGRDAGRHVVNPARPAVLRAGADRPRIDGPGDFQLAHVGRVDLCQRAETASGLIVAERDPSPRPMFVSGLASSPGADG